MHITDSSVLVTGANRGIGAALVAAALSRGASRVYAASRVPVTTSDDRVVPVTLDVTDPNAISRMAAGIDQLDVLINNAGIAEYDDLSDGTVLERHFAVNVFGVHAVTNAMLPALERNGGAIINNVSMMALMPFPHTPSYAASKSAAFNLTQAWRLLLAPRGIRVLAALTGPTDTDMTSGFDIPKASPSFVAEAILDGLERGDEEIFPDPMSALLADNWRDGDVKNLERQYAQMLTTGRP